MPGRSPQSSRSSTSYDRPSPARRASGRDGRNDSIVRPAVRSPYRDRRHATRISSSRSAVPSASALRAAPSDRPTSRRTTASGRLRSSLRRHIRPSGARRVARRDRRGRAPLADPIVDPRTIEHDARRVLPWIVGAELFERTAEGRLARSPKRSAGKRPCWSPHPAKPNLEHGGSNLQSLSVWTALRPSGPPPGGTEWRTIPIRDRSRHHIAPSGRVEFPGAQFLALTALRRPERLLHEARDSTPFIIRLHLQSTA